MKRLTRLEGELLQAQKMEVMGRLAAGVAHDFNNLLTVIAVSSRILLDHMTEEHARQEVVTIQDATARVADAEGSIAIETKLGKGTTFRVRLPLVEIDPTSAQQP